MTTPQDEAKVVLAKRDRTGPPGKRPKAKPRPKGNGAAKPQPPAALSRDDILGLSDAVIEPVLIAEWNGQVHVRTMSAAAQAEFDNMIVGDRFEAPGLVAALIAVFTVCDAEGNLLFSVDDVELLAEKSGSALAKIMTRARPLNGLMSEDETAKN